MKIYVLNFFAAETSKLWQHKIIKCHLLFLSCEHIHWIFTFCIMLFQIPHLCSNSLFQSQFHFYIFSIHYSSIPKPVLIFYCSYTNYWKLCILKQHRFIILEFCRQKIWLGAQWTKTKCQWAAFLSEVSSKESVSWSFGLVIETSFLRL